ncbi:MAG: hypothetical protein ACM31C_21370 [Acidobacteriota bacterium]
MRALAVVLVLAASPALADKLDDAFATTQQAQQHYAALRDQYATLRARWDQAYKPLVEHYPVELAAYKNMAAACGGAGRGSPACSQATLAWAAAVKQRQSLEWHAAELDPKHEADSQALVARDREVAAAKADFERAFDQAKTAFADARARARTPADRTKIDDKLAARETQRQQRFAATRGSAADRANPGGRGGNSGGSGRSNNYDPTATVNSTIHSW